MIELAIVTALILLNGLFALSELAVVSARPGRLQALVDAGVRGAATAQKLRSNPGRFLSGVQIGITLVGVLNGAYSGETFGEDAADALIGLGVSRNVAEPLGFGIVIVLVTYLSIIIGELVPKNIALRNPERIAALVAPAMVGFARFASPAVWLLDASTKLIFRLTGQSLENEQQVTDEEIKALIAEAETAGVIERDEHELLSGVLRLGDRGVLAVMTPRTDVDWIDVNAGEAAVRQRLVSTQHSRLPAGEGPDAMLGVVHAREVLAAVLSGQPLDIRAFIRTSPIIPDTTDAIEALGVLRGSHVPMALVHDEYGHFEGLVTPADLLEAIAGAFKTHSYEDSPLAEREDDDTWLLSGSLPADEMAEKLSIALPGQRGYETVAGFILAHLQHLPMPHESFLTKDWRFEVVGVRGNRIDKVRATRRLPIRRPGLA